MSLYSFFFLFSDLIISNDLCLSLQIVSSERAKLGAIQNRMEYTSNSLAVASENMTNAQSRIADVDMASEVIEMTSAQILQQASNAMVAQANTAAQTVLQLLR